jgi:acyl-CoA thioesterase-1
VVHAKKMLASVSAAIALMVFGATGTAIAQVQVAIVGDSNVYGKGVSSSVNYPTQLEAALKARGLNVRVINSGINGDTTSGVLSRLDSAAPQGTKVAVVWVGVNDRRRGGTAETINAGRAQIAARLRARGIDVFTITPASYDRTAHQNPALNIGDGHLNEAGYRMMVSRTIGPIAAMVKKASQK